VIIISDKKKVIPSPVSSYPREINLVDDEVVVVKKEKPKKNNFLKMFGIDIEAEKSQTPGKK